MHFEIYNNNNKRSVIGKYSYSKMCFERKRSSLEKKETILESIYYVC